MSVPSFLIVDDHPLFLEALQFMLEANYPGARIDVAQTIDKARARLEAGVYSLVLLDLKMPDATGFEGLVSLRSKCRNTPLAVISAMTGRELLKKAKSCGADGFIYKSQARKDILQAVSALLAGSQSFPEEDNTPITESRSESEDFLERLRQLTPQQVKVLNEVCKAKLNKQIAHELGVTETTIKAHITIIFKKIGVHSRTQAVLKIQRLRTDIDASEFGGVLIVDA
jgi:DNA-binding NarL/FixJ family response regulator